MTRRFLIILILLTLFIPLGFSQDIGKDDRLRELIQLYGQAEITIPITGTIDLQNLTLNVSITSVRDKTIHLTLSPINTEWFILQNYNYSIIERVESKGVTMAYNLNEVLEWDSYPSYTQYDSIMQSFKTLYPALCHLDTIGTSINGKLVLALKISDNAGIDEDEPEVFYSSTIHGDETGGYVLMLRLASYLLVNYDTDPRIKNLIDNLEIWINPLANPDGTYRIDNTISSPTRFNANGVDLNRNFPDPFLPFVVQQKENQDMIMFMREHRFVLSANFHSGAEVVNYPWDRYYSRLHADDSWFYSISRAYADTVHVYSGPAYMNDLDNGVTRGAVWYIVYGGRQDFITSELQGREVTIELDAIKTTPAAQLGLLWDNNRRSLIGYLENALYGIHGSVFNSETNVPVAAKIFIDGYDRDSSHVYSDTLTGSFVRFLSPGIWNLTFSATGYIDTVLSNISVSHGAKTEIVVYMEPTLSKVDLITPGVLNLFPNPASDEITVVLPSGFVKSVNIRIISQSGKIMKDFDKDITEGIPFTIDISGLSAGVYSLVFVNSLTKSYCWSKFIVTK